MRYLQKLLRNHSRILLFSLLALDVEFALAAPVDGRAVQGAVSITYNPPVIRIVQQTEDAVVQWRSFNLSVGERLEIVQPSRNSRLITEISAPL